MHPAHLCCVEWKHQQKEKCLYSISQLLVIFTLCKILRTVWHFTFNPVGRICRRTPIIWKNRCNGGPNTALDEVLVSVYVMLTTCEVFIFYVQRNDLVKLNVGCKSPRPWIANAPTDWGGGLSPRWPLWFFLAHFHESDKKCCDFTVSVTIQRSQRCPCGERCAYVKG